MRLSPISKFQAALALFALAAATCLAGEELVTSAQDGYGQTVSYILNAENASPRYVVILFPGGNGNVDPRMVDGKLVYGFRGNFVVRTRPLMVDHEFATVTTNSTQVEERIQAVIDDLKARFPAARIYLMSTSNGTFDSMRLAGYLSTRIAGEIHTSALQAVASFNGRKYPNRQLVVHHKEDGCRATPFSAARASHDRYGTDFIAMEGGISVGDPCEPFGHHGFNGIEKATIDAIKDWIRQGK